MRFEVDFKAAPVLARMERARRAALGATAENVLADCNEYVPYEFGTLEGSGQALDHGDHWTVEWGGTAAQEYARVQYYGVGLNHDTDANAAHGGKATHHWFDAARAVRADAWEGMAGAEYARAMGGGA